MNNLNLVFLYRLNPHVTYMKLIIHHILIHLEEKTKINKHKIGNVISKCI